MCIIFNIIEFHYMFVSNNIENHVYKFEVLKKINIVKLIYKYYFIILKS